jgi:Fe-S-cluster containining protein
LKIGDGIEILWQMYQEWTSQVDAEARKRGAQCAAGCSECCRILALCSQIEAQLIVAEHAGRPGLEARLQAASLLCQPGVDRAAYHEARIPCIFLQDGRCSIYVVRPAVCRWHYSLQAPSYCEPSYKGLVAHLNTGQLQAEVARLDQTVFGAFLPAPIPIAVLHALGRITGHPAMEPLDWVAQHMGEDRGKVLRSMSGADIGLLHKYWQDSAA